MTSGTAALTGMPVFYPYCPNVNATFYACDFGSRFLGCCLSDSIPPNTFTRDVRSSVATVPWPSVFKILGKKGGPCLGRKEADVDENQCPDFGIGYGVFKSFFDGPEFIDLVVHGSGETKLGVSSFLLGEPALFSPERGKSGSTKKPMIPTSVVAAPSMI